MLMGSLKLINIILVDQMCDEKQDSSMIPLNYQETNTQYNAAYEIPIHNNYYYSTQSIWLMIVWIFCILSLMVHFLLFFFTLSQAGPTLPHLMKVK